MTSPIQVTSPTLGLDRQLPLLEVRSTGAEQSSAQGVTPIENPVVGGTLLPVDLRALVGTGGAVSSIEAGVADIDVLGGILGLTSTELGLASNAMTTQASGDRSLSIDGLTVLDLEALLAGLGIPLTDLPLETVLGLIDELGLLPQLGTALDDLGLPVDLDSLSTESVGALIDDLGEVPALVTTLSGDTGATTCDTTDPVLGAVGGLIGQDTTALCDDVTATVAEITAVVPDLDALLGDGIQGEP